jgi:hypothetical protein
MTGKLLVVTCDGHAQRTRMISLGLDADAPLPQFALNTKDGRQLPLIGRGGTAGRGAPSERLPNLEHRLSKFVADFLGERLRDRAPPALAPSPPTSGVQTSPDASTTTTPAPKPVSATSTAAGSSVGGWTSEEGKSSGGASGLMADVALRANEPHLSHS